MDFMHQVSVLNDALREALCEFVLQEEHVVCRTHVPLVADGLRIDDERDDAAVLRLGYGRGTFEWEGTLFVIERRRYGNNVTSRSCHQEVSMMDEVEIACASPQDALRLLQASKEWHDRNTSEKIEVYRWCAANEYWRRESQVAPRRMETVYIDEALKKDLLDDLHDFDSAQTRDWYARHCIPFRRGMLLHGPPGTGKTSLIVAIATQMQRGIYRVSLCAPKLCDDTLLSAMNNVRLKAIVVLEDIDALWGVHREKSELGANVTFSGLLNSLDGITEAKGALFLFTTNHPEKLDPALRRRGRIDREFYIGPCSEHTARHMFECFYPKAQKEAVEFSRKLKPHRGVTTSQLQEHFISMRKHDAATAACEFEPQASDLSSGNMWG